MGSVHSRPTWLIEDKQAYRTAVPHNAQLQWYENHVLLDTDHVIISYNASDLFSETPGSSPSRGRLSWEYLRYLYFSVVGANLCVSPTSLACGQKENKHIYYVNQRHYRHGKWDSELQSTAAGKCVQDGQYMLPSLTPLWSSCLLLVTDLERTVSPRLQYSKRLSGQNSDCFFCSILYTSQFIIVV
jgi:hypothetical protein